MKETIRKTQDMKPGLQFGRLVTVESTGKRKRNSMVWKCQCSCGKFANVSTNDLIFGNNRSCGCLKKEVNGAMGEQKYLHFVDGTCVELIKEGKRRSDNTSGHRGVSRKGESKWVAYIGFKGVKHYLGTYSTCEEAVAARKKAETEFYQPLLREFSVGGDTSD